MKKLILVFLLTSMAVQARVPSIDEAPYEWLVAQTLLKKMGSYNHIWGDKLLDQVLDSIDYDSEIDELRLTSNKKTHQLRKEMLSFLSERNKAEEVDLWYEKWRGEGKSPIEVRTRKREIHAKGFYFFNHVHTKISQDNSSLKFLKISPEKTMKLIKGFLKKRKKQGVAAITDHDTDHGFDEVDHLINDDFGILRGVEWGGTTHMCLVDIKKDWDLLDKGREFRHEESVIKSRSSGGFRIVNHPSKKDDFPFTRWLDADGVEVWNTIMEDAAFRKIPLKKSNNREALQQWVNSLSAGKRHTAVAGSDFHFIIPCLRDRSLHYPANYFPEPKSDVKELLMKGRNSIVTLPTAPLLNLQASFGNGEWAKMGDEISGSGELKVLLTADFSDSRTKMRSVCYNVIDSFTKLITFWKKKRWELRFYNMSGELVAKEKINPRKYKPGKGFISGFKMSIPTGSSDLIRAELWSINKKTKVIDLLGLTNPIYINR